MKSTEHSAKGPVLLEKTRVRLLKRDHRENSHPATLLRVLPNPSGIPENQWYDVQFDDGVYGRFLERYLERIEGSSEETAKKEGGQASAA